MFQELGDSYAMLLPPCQDEWRPLLRELMAHADLDQWCNPLPKMGIGSFAEPLPNTCLHWSRQVEWPWALSESGLNKGCECLEVGGAGTPFKYAVARRCRSLVQTEVDPGEMPQIRMQIDNQRDIWGIDNITQVRADVRDLPFPDDWFDRVFCISVVEHIAEDRAQAMRELARVLKPSGVLLLTMDMVIEGARAGSGDNFYVDIPGCRALLGELGICNIINGNGGGTTAFGAPMQDEGVTITTALVRWVKPLKEAK